jgi:hypothetical protein
MELRRFTVSAIAVLMSLVVGSSGYAQDKGKGGSDAVMRGSTKDSRKSSRIWKMKGWRNRLSCFNRRSVSRRDELNRV